VRTVRFVNQPPDRYGPLRILRRRDFEVEGAGFFEASDDILISTFEVIKDGSLTSLREAVSRYNRYYDGDDDPVELWVSADGPQTFDAENSLFIDVTRLFISPDAILITVEQPTAERASPEAVQRLLWPLLARSRSSLEKVTPIESPHGYSVEVSIAISSRGRTVGDALDIGGDVSSLLEAAFVSGRLSPSTVGAVLRAGHQDILVGQRETEWLDAKGSLYDLDERGSFMLARDIAAFANAAGGLIAIGMRTTKVRGEDIIAKARPVPLEGLNIARHHAIVRNWIYPRPLRVRFDLTLTERDPDYGIVVIEVPDQPVALKPFFVRRANVAGRVRTEHLALPVRVGADTSHWDLAEVHSLIVAGRAALAQSTPPAADRRDGDEG